MGAERCGFNFLQDQTFLSTQPRQLQLCALTKVLWDKVDRCMCGYMCECVSECELIYVCVCECEWICVCVDICVSVCVGV